MSNSSDRPRRSAAQADRRSCSQRQARRPRRPATPRRQLHLTDALGSVSAHHRRDVADLQPTRHRRAVDRRHHALDAFQIPMPSSFSRSGPKRAIPRTHRSSPATGSPRTLVALGDRHGATVGDRGLNRRAGAHPDRELSEPPAGSQARSRAQPTRLPDAGWRQQRHRHGARRRRPGLQPTGCGHCREETTMPTPAVPCTRPACRSPRRATPCTLIHAGRPVTSVLWPHRELADRLAPGSQGEG